MNAPKYIVNETFRMNFRTYSDRSFIKKGTKQAIKRDNLNELKQKVNTKYNLMRDKLNVKYNDFSSAEKTQTETI